MSSYNYLTKNIYIYLSSLNKPIHNSIDDHCNHMYYIIYILQIIIGRKIETYLPICALHS